MGKLSPLMILPPAIFLAFAVMFGIAMWRDDPNGLPSARQGQEAPPLQVTAMGEKPVVIDATLRDGEVKLVNFWASWCGPCRVEHPNLTALAEGGLPVYGINYKDQPANAAAFLRELGDPYAGMGVDGQGRTALDWGLYGVPETYVVAGDGTIILRFAGPVTQRVIEETLSPAINAARQR